MNTTSRVGVVVIDQGTGVIQQHLLRYPAKVTEGAFQASESRRLPLVPEGVDIVAAGIAQGGDKQEDLDRLPIDADLTATQVDLQLLAGRRLEPYRGLGFGGQCLTQGCAGALHRAQAGP